MSQFGYSRGQRILLVVLFYFVFMMFFLFVTVLLSYFMYGSWDYAWAIWSYTIIFGLIAIILGFTPIAGVIISTLFFIFKWDSMIAVSLGLPVSSLTFFASGIQLILSIIINVFFTLYLFRPTGLGPTLKNEKHIKIIIPKKVKKKMAS